jgi:hypothetical protein
MSNNLELAQVAAAQNQKEVTINDQAGQLDAGLTDKVDVALSFADDLAGARAYAGVSATAATVLDVHKNGSPIGTITFGIGASTGTFATAGAGAETFAAGTASRSSTRTRRMPRSPISRSPSRARGPDHGLGFRYGGHAAHEHHR